MRDGVTTGSGRGALPPAACGDSPRDISGPKPGREAFGRRAFGRRGLILSVLALAACGGRDSLSSGGDVTRSGLYPNETPHLRQRINFWARHYEVPSSLVQRVIIRESTHRPEARNGPYYGLMQIHPQTARTMGHRGPDAALLDADTNLKYGVKYLRGAWLVAEGNPDRTIMWYSRGYYYEARRKGLLRETGLRS